MISCLKCFLIAGIYDPLEQFEIPLPFDLSYNSNIISFLLAVITIILFEKLLNFSLGDGIIKSLLNGLISSNLGYAAFSLFYVLYSVFILIFSANMTGLFAYSFTETAAIPLVFLFSFSIFFGILLMSIDLKRSFFFNFFLPAGTPQAILKLIIVIEIVSYLTRVVSLGLRLLANMISGHILLKILISFIWLMITAETFLSYFFFFPWVMVLAVLGLEILIAFLQSYVFVFLSIVFVKEIL